MTGALLAVPTTEDAALVEEARRLAEELVADGEPRPAVVAVAFDGVIDPEDAAAGGPDEVLRVGRESGSFALGAAGVRARAAALAELAGGGAGGDAADSGGADAGADGGADADADSGGADADATDGGADAGARGGGADDGDAPAGVVAESPRAILLPDTPDGADLAAATARELRGACVTDCLLRVRDGDLSAGRVVYGGRAYAELALEGEPAVVTLDSEALGTPAEADPDDPATHTVTVDVPEEAGVRHVETLDVPESDLSKARRIVAGGRGLGRANGFEVIEDLADGLGAAVGASRPPADDGWVAYDRQIGVTGKEIDVELYVPCAISGDSYHMRSVNADHLVAINADPDAHIFDVADLGVVGDVYEYGPALADALREAAGDGARTGDSDDGSDGGAEAGDGDSDDGSDGGAEAGDGDDGTGDGDGTGDSDEQSDGGAGDGPQAGSDDATDEVTE